MSKLPVLHLKKKSQASNHTDDLQGQTVDSSTSTSDSETPSVRRTRKRIERLEQMRAQVLERIEQRERAIQDQKWMAVIRRVAPGWTLETVAGGLAAAFAECKEDPTYFEEITTFGKTLLAERVETKE